MTESRSRRPTWLQNLHSLFGTRNGVGISCVDLFCGAGGLSLGFWSMGFDVQGFDSNSDATTTYSANLALADCVDLKGYTGLPKADVILAGPPCQPWSRAGKRLGKSDDRNGMPIVERAVATMQPQAVVIENVPDLASIKYRQQLDKFGESMSQLGYKTTSCVLNAADYGVPQNRKRLFAIALREPATFEIPPPWPTAVASGQAIPGTCKHHVRGTRTLSAQMDAYVARYERASGCKQPRDLHLDRPARTLTVRNLSGATGDMMRIRLPDDSRRTLSVREAARLQSFPDWFRFTGSHRRKMEQIGNAVPPLLARSVAGSILEYLQSNRPTSPDCS